MSSIPVKYHLSDPMTEQFDWGKVFESHRRWIATVVRARLADPEAQADVLQDVALAAISQPNRPDSPDKIAPWLYRITLRKIVTHHRNTGRRRRLLESVAKNIPAQDPSTCGEPGAWLLQKETSKSIQEGLSKLDPQDRQLLLLKYTEGWSYEQLAQHLGVSIKTIEYRLLRARNALRTELMGEA
ncbi:MAG: RNA polymerase sigma factor [Planctomycetota bacterium]